MTFSIAYVVTAQTQLEAINKAVLMLRTGVQLRGVGQVTRVGDRWTVCLNCWEDA